jgi:hypothetical protein
MARATPSTHRCRTATLLIVLGWFCLVGVFVTVSFSGAAAVPLDTPLARQFSAENAERLSELTKPFVIAVLPDTQSYSSRGRIEFKKQVDWLLANAKDKNIVFVTHLGDVVDGGKSDRQWARALKALDPLLAQDWLPFSIVLGNHDDPEYFKRHLPLSLMSSKPWFVGAGPSGLSQAQMFQVEGARFLHIGFPIWPSPEDLHWADRLLERPDLAGVPVIVTTHEYLEGDGKTATGKRIWNDFVTNNPMVFMVLCGHIARERNFVEYNTAGLPVYEMLSDYQQFRPFGGNGLMRLITIDPAKDTIEVKTFSPYYRYTNGAKTDTDYYETDADSQFQYTGAFSW